MQKKKGLKICGFKRGFISCQEFQPRGSSCCRVTVTYAVVDPGAVVVEYLDAVVADGAVGAAGRPIELTRHTPLHPHLHTQQQQI